MPPNEVLTEEILEELADNRLERETEEIKEWRHNLRKEYLKDKFNSFISIEQIILISIIYNLTQIISEFNSILYTINTENIIETSILLLITNKFKSTANIKTNNLGQLLSRVLRKIKFYTIIWGTPLFLYSVTGVTFQDEVLNGWDKMADKEVAEEAAWEAQDAAQDARDEAAEQAGAAAELQEEYEHCARLLRDLSDITNRSVIDLAQSLINQNLHLLSQDQIEAINTTNISTTPNNIPATPNNTPAPTEIDSDNETDSGNSMTSTDNNSDSTIKTDYKSDSIFDSFTPLILLITNKFPWSNIRRIIFLITLRIGFGIWCASTLEILSSLDPLYNNEILISLTPFLILTSTNPLHKLIAWIKRVIINKIFKLFISWLELNNTSIWCVTLLHKIKVGRSKQTDENQIDLKQVADKQIQTTNSLQESFNNKQSPLVFNRELTKSTESTDTELDDDSIDFAITQDLLKEKEIFEWKLTWLRHNPINRDSWVYNWVVTQWKELYPNDYDSDSEESGTSTSDLTSDTSKQSESIGSKTTNYGDQLDTPTYPWISSSPEDALKMIRKDLPNLPQDVRASVVTMIQGFENLSELAEEDRRHIIATHQELRYQSSTNNRLKGLNIKTNL
jgi:hypothetical protein